MKKRMYKIMALAMTAAMVVPMAAQTTAFAADDKEITYWNIAVESPDKDIVTAAVDKFNKETKSGYTVNQVAIQNDTYKEKLVIAMSSGECPDMYSSWSGGPMYEYIDSGLLSRLMIFLISPMLKINFWMQLLNREATTDMYMRSHI
jgi:raffinose/stachyose/melibiose transport system substrate-binding protein